MRKAHAPGQGGGRAVVTVAREQAADTADAVAERRGGGAGVEHFENGNFVVARQPDEGGEAGDEPSEPSKTILTENLAEGIGEEFARRLQSVVELCADNAREARDGDEHFGERRAGIGDAAAGEVGAQGVIGGDHGERDHQAISGDGERAEVDERYHGGQYS